MEFSGEILFADESSWLTLTTDSDYTVDITVSLTGASQGTEAMSFTVTPNSGAARLPAGEIIRSLVQGGGSVLTGVFTATQGEELCDNIALINKSHLVITGGVNEIRHKWGNNNIELIYTGEDRVKDAAGIFKVLSDEDNAGRHTAVLTLLENVSSNDALSALLAQDIVVNSFKELIPRMNDIFIKLVTEEA